MLLQVKSGLVMLGQVMSLQDTLVQVMSG